MTRKGENEFWRGKKTTLGHLVPLFTVNFQDAFIELAGQEFSACLLLMSLEDHGGSSAKIFMDDLHTTVLQVIFQNVKSNEPVWSPSFLQESSPTHGVMEIDRSALRYRCLLLSMYPRMPCELFVISPTSNFCISGLKAAAILAMHGGHAAYGEGAFPPHGHCQAYNCSPEHLITLWPPNGR